MSIPSRFGVKQFGSKSRGVLPKQLLMCIDEALSAAPLAAHGPSFVAADWDPWQVLGTARPDNGLTLTEDNGTVIAMPGYSFDAVTRYRERQAAVGRTFGSQGSLELFCASGISAVHDLTTLVLYFSDNPAIPMWRSYASELAVYETVKTIAEFLRHKIFGGLQDPVLFLEQGGWANQVFGDFGATF